MEDSKATEGLAGDATVTETTVTDEALTAALEGKETSEPEPTVKATEAEPEHPDEGQEEQDEDHAIKTRLGRKVKKLEEVMVTKDEFKQLMTKLDTFMTRPAETQVNIADELPEYVATSEDVRKVFKVLEKEKEVESSNKAKEEARQREAYAKEYTTYLMAKKDEDGKDLHDEIVNLMLDKKDNRYNLIITGNSQVDARTNYAEAKAAVLSRQTTKTVPVKGEKAVGTGVTHGVTNTQTKVTLPKLTPEAENFVAYMRRQGMSDESIAEALR